MIKKLISIFLTMCMVLTMVPTTVAWAAGTTGTFGDFTVTYSGTAPTFSSNILTFSAAGESYTVGMAAGKTSTSNCIMVSANGVTLSLNGVTICAPDNSGESALTVTGSNTTLNVSGNSSLTGGSGNPDAINPGNGGNGISGNVGITGAKTLAAYGGAAGAGAVGSSNGGNGINGDVFVSSTATVNATGGFNYNAGGGSSGAGINGNVTVTGAASLTATGGIGGLFSPGGDGISGGLTVTDIATVSLTGGESGRSYNPGRALTGTLTADDGFINKGGYTGLTDDITPSDVQLNQYRYIAVSFPTAAGYAAASPAATSDSDYVLDTGSKTLIIKTAKGAAFWSANGTTYLDYTVKLANDIDVSAFQWTSVGSWRIPFTGTFDGQGHSIAHLKVHETGNHAGFFGQTSGSTIKNLCIASGSIIAAAGGESYAGSIVGNAQDNSTIVNCCNHADVFCTSSSASQTSASGIAGSGYYPIITNCYNTGNITAACSKIASYAGGIIGSTSNGTVANCYNTGTLSASGATSNYAAGLTGYMNYNGSVTNCYSKQGSNLKGNSNSSFTFTGCGTFADNGGALTAGTSANCGTKQSLTAYATNLLSALNGWVNTKAKLRLLHMESR